MRIVLSAPVGVRVAVETTLTDALGERRIGAGELSTSAGLPSPHSGWHPVANRGGLTVQVTLSGGLGEPLGAGSLSLPLEGGGQWSVEALVFRPAPGIPAPPCFGCEAETRVPLRPSAAAGVVAGDSLFLRATRMPAAGRAPVPPN
ncbi:MAG: hypothetical protein AB1941_04190 [Gemmatimonadota bacterium]